MRRRAIDHLAAWVIGILEATIPATRAAETDNPWSVSVYYGPYTTEYAGAIVQSFNFRPTATMFGLALDRNLLYLGYGIHFAAETQITQYFFGHRDTSGAFGIGFRVNDVFGLKRTSFAIYDGPSYDTDPPYTAIGYKDKIWGAQRTNFLNYVSAEIAFALPRTRRWFGVLRFYHRSGMLGLYGNSDDAGMAVGLGLQYRF